MNNNKIAIKQQLTIFRNAGKASPNFDSKVQLAPSFIHSYIYIIISLASTQLFIVDKV